MKTREQPFGFQHNLLMLAMIATFGAAHAADDEVAKLISPDDTEISVGAAIVSPSRESAALFGQYNGWSNIDNALLLDFDLIQRDDATGTWVTAAGRDLGLDSREISFSSSRQGAWKVALDYRELVRHDPRTLKTGLTGIGSSQLAVNSLSSAGSGTSQNLDTKRRSYSVGLEDWITPGLSLEFSIRSENKSGARLNGIGGYCSSGTAGASCPTLSGALLMLAEPISSNTQQLEAKANFVGKNYSLTAGYYVTVYRNDQGSMQVAGINGNLFDTGNVPFSASTGANSLGGLLSQPVALAPDNQAYQMYLSGTYALTPSTHATLYYAATHATQNESFASQGLAATAGLPASLNGVVDSKIGQLSLTARPMAKLTLMGKVRYEKIEDQTPQALYGGTYSNPLNSSTKSNSKAEATYVFPANFRGTLGVDYNWIKRLLPEVGSTIWVIPPSSLTSIREMTNELVYRAELRKPLLDTLNATLVYSSGKRYGGNWINLGSTSAQYPNTYQTIRYADAYSATGVFPSTMMDRKRDNVRVLFDWAASDALSLQFNTESGRDSYAAPTLTGLKSAETRAIGVDASLAINDSWRATGFLNTGEQRLNVSHDAGYIARINNVTTHYGVGVVGKLKGKTEVGGDLSYIDDGNAYGLASGNSSAPGILPDVSYRMLALKVFAKYTLDAQSAIRVDLVHQKADFDEWTWGYAGVPFAYSDNSTVSMNPNQNVTYLGVKYVYRLK
jgi:MtrB/PioB family decaheme-associated outer membrane protein